MKRREIRRRVWMALAHEPRTVEAICQLTGIARPLVLDALGRLRELGRCGYGPDRRVSGSVLHTYLRQRGPDALTYASRTVDVTTRVINGVVYECVSSGQLESHFPAPGLGTTLSGLVP